MSRIPRQLRLIGDTAEKCMKRILKRHKFDAGQVADVLGECIEKSRSIYGQAGIAYFAKPSMGHTWEFAFSAKSCV